MDAISTGMDQPLLGTRTICWSGRLPPVRLRLAGRRLTGTGRRLLLATIGAVGLLLLVLVGPYPVSMITAGSDALSNFGPTRLTIAFQTALVLSLEKPLTTPLHWPRLWLVTVMVNRGIMTWFLWHLTVMGVAHVLLALVARALLPEPLTGTWWATNPLWWLVLLVIPGVIVLIMGRFEEPRPDDRAASATWKPIAAPGGRDGGVRDGAGAGGEVKQGGSDIAT